jgi:steroid 5-alpha reductase family enzyme
MMSTVIVVLFVYMTAWFGISLWKKRNDVADIGWGLGFILLAWVAFLTSSIQTVRGLLVAVLVTFWGLRLASHIYKRNKGKAEDSRYLKWRETWGKWFYLRSYFQVYILQGIFLFLISLPIVQINLRPNIHFGWLDILGAFVWLFAFIFESLADRELALFIKDPNNKGKILQTGLWKYSRHPNYFGEVLSWWGIWLISLSVLGGIWTILGPITITVLILYVSGVPLLEERLKSREGYAEYIRKTNKFFPWRPGR